MSKENAKNTGISENAGNSPSETAEPETTQVSTEAPNVPETATGEMYENTSSPKKQKTKKSTQKTPAPEFPENETTTEQPVEPTGDELPTGQLASLPETELAPEPEIEAVLEQNQCPRCGHNVTDPKRISEKVQKYPIAGVRNGVPYQLIESRQITCDKCGQLFAVNKYV